MADDIFSILLERVTETKAALADEVIPLDLRRPAERSLSTLERIANMTQGAPFAEALTLEAESALASMRQLRVAAQAYAEKPAATEHIASELQSGLAKLDAGVYNLADAANEAAIVDGRAEGYVRSLSTVREELDARRLAGEVRDARDAAVQVLEETRKAAGTTGSTAMSTHLRTTRNEAEFRDELRAQLGRRALLGSAVIETPSCGPSTVDEATQLIERVAGVLRKP